MTIQDLKEWAFMQNQSDFSNNNCKSDDILEQSLLDIFPICNIIPSLLHLLLGIGNKLISLFFTYYHEWFEALVQIETEAETVSILAELDYNDKIEEYKLLKLEA